LIDQGKAQRVREIIETLKPLAIEYYQLTGKPLGVTGEIAEVAAADALGLELVVARTRGFDAIRKTVAGEEHVQIKGRACTSKPNMSQRLGKIKRDSACDVVLLVLLDVATLAPIGMWEAPFSAVQRRLDVPGSEARARGALRLNEFMALATKVWPQSKGGGLWPAAKESC
jgi:hypothetical protein